MDLGKKTLGYYRTYVPQRAGEGVGGVIDRARVEVRRRQGYTVILILLYVEGAILLRQKSSNS